MDNWRELWTNEVWKLCKLLGPLTVDEMIAVAQKRTGRAWPHLETLTLADAGLEEEVRELLTKLPAQR